MSIELDQTEAALALTGLMVLQSLGSEPPPVIETLAARLEAYLDGLMSITEDK
jgi:hypothetical protein